MSHMRPPPWPISLLLLLLLLLLSSTTAQIQSQQGGIGGVGSLNQNINPNQDAGVLFSGVGTNPLYSVNMVPFGKEAGDQEVHQGFLTSGQTIDLHMYFPFYGGLYNYTTISVNGYLGFATVLDQGPTINYGPESTDWPRQQDPAMIAPYLCKQQIPQDGNPGLHSGVFYRLIMRQSMFGRGASSNMNYGGPVSQQSSFFGLPASQACPNTPDSYVKCDSISDQFLEEMMRWLTEGVAGAAVFRADAALVVTWYNTASAISGRSDIDAGQLASYQVIWLTDSTARLSYVILNYDKLGFDAQDFRMNSRSGRCNAIFNGGNHTGYVPVDPTFQFKNSPKVLAQQSGVPHMVRGRYMFRVDDVVRPAGCSNKTGGTFPMLIYPNIVNMLGEMTVDVNAICLNRAQTYILMIEQRQAATCTVLNPSIARCHLPKIYDWGTKTVYFQPQSGGANDEKAFVGYIYFVPPTLDPMRLDIGNVYDWFKNPVPYQTMPISWFPRNFTNPQYDGLLDSRNVGINDDQMYSVQLGLYVVGYKETRDDDIKKFRPEHRVLARLGTYQNKNTYDYRWKAQEEKINIYQIEQWYLDDWERMNTLYTFRFGYLKLAPVKNDQTLTRPELLSGLVSSPISLHWMWTTNNPQYLNNNMSPQDEHSRVEFVKQKSKEMCGDWYNEDGALWNFIRDVETNSSCPCIEKQAIADIGRFMPHPRCSQTFRDITCTTAIGARNCYMSAQNVLSSYSGQSHGYESMTAARFPTHYGQVCCYDADGYLMQTSYQPVIKVTPEVPYNPGFPSRAYEFGTTPYMGQFEVPGLSMFHHDQMPYFLCCKFADFRCQMFYWRRPSSGCQQYQPPAYGEVLGAGTFNTIDNQKFIFNEPGVYTLLYIPPTEVTPEVKIQVRMERYPNRKVDFSMLGKYIDQGDLVQPTNATVITGVVMEATGTDRVHVLARGDTRRFRYRTSIIVGNILRYFDTMKIQRFKGTTIYVNNVERGQAEIYVVLEEAQIGLRIRESHNLDIDRLPMYQESMGMLDVALSVPPQYGVRPDGDNTRDQEFRRRFNLPRVQGLMRPFPDQPSNPFNMGILTQDVNSDSIHQQVVSMYRVTGSGETSASNADQPGILNRDIPSENMFSTSRDEDKKFDVFPEAAMKSGPIYKTSSKYTLGHYGFRPRTGQDLTQLLNNCRQLKENPQAAMQPLQGQIGLNYGAEQCPDNPGTILSECGDSWPCLYDYVLFNAKTLGNNMKNEWNRLQGERHDAMRYYNSCGPINIEYPEYLMKTSSMHSAYMQGDVARFECFQSHWIKGVYEYKCGLVVDLNRPESWRYEWNKGEQPWCRSREKENFFIWLAVIMGFIAVIMIIIFIFLSFWCVKQKKKVEFREKVLLTRSNSMAKYPPSSLEEEPLNGKPRYSDLTPREDKTAIRDSPPRSRGPQYSFPPPPSHLSTTDHTHQRGLMGLDTSV